MIKHIDIEYKAGICLDLYLPDPGNEPCDLFVYAHGGGLEHGSRHGIGVFAETLAKHNVATASIDYRMYPNAKFPEYIEDAAEAVRWLKDNIATYAPVRRIFVGGSSAGGYISQMLCFDSRYFEAVGIAPSDIAGYIHDAGQPTAHFKVLDKAGEDGRRVIVDERAPLYFVGMQETYPPMLIVVSDDDMFGRYEQTMLLSRTLEHFGHGDKVFVDVQHGKHCAYVYQKDEADGEGVFGKIILNFLDKLDA